jgi:hypothetical protein
MTVQNIKISTHGYKQMIDRGLIPSKCPFKQARSIIYNYIKESQSYKSLRSTIYMINNYEFVFSNSNQELITFINKNEVIA